MSFWGDLVDFFVPGPAGDIAERIIEREEQQWAVEAALSDMQGMAGNEGQFIIITDKVPKPFKDYFMEYASNFGPDMTTYESWMRAGMGSDEYYDAVNIILEVGFEYAAPSFW